MAKLVLKHRAFCNDDGSFVENSHWDEDITIAQTDRANHRAIHGNENHLVDILPKYFPVRKKRTSDSKKFAKASKPKVKKTKTKPITKSVKRKSIPKSNSKKKPQKVKIIVVSKRKDEN